MVKLYQNDGEVINYWETWDKDEKTGVIHWGIIGQRGHNEEVKSSLFSNISKQIQKIIDQKIREGYAQIDVDEHHTLLIEYQVDGMGTAEDVEKRTKLQDKMDDILGWTGLGHCDGGSVGSGTMEVCCIVIDFDIAKSVIEESLKGTEFGNYIRIYDENEV
jgi:hypothetical protein